MRGAQLDKKCLLTLLSFFFGFSDFIGEKP